MNDQEEKPNESDEITRKLLREMEKTDPKDGPKWYAKHAARCLDLATEIEKQRKIINRMTAVQDGETTTRPAKVRDTICALYAAARTRGETTALSGRSLKAARTFAALFSVFDSIEIEEKEE